MQLTLILARDLQNAIRTHFDKGLKALIVSDKFTKTIVYLINKEFKNAYEKEYIPSEVSHIAQYSNIIEINLVLEIQQGRYYRPTTLSYELSKSYPIMDTGLIIAKSNKPTCITKETHFAMGMSKHSAVLYLDKTNTINEGLKEFIERKESFILAKNTLVKVTEEELSKSSSIERLVLRLPAIKSFLLRQGVQI